MGKGHRKGWKKEENRRKERSSKMVGRKRIEGVLLMLASITVGLIAELVYQKIEIALVCGLIAVWCITSLIFLWSPYLSRRRKPIRAAIRASILAVTSIAGLILILPLYEQQHAALTEGDLIGAGGMPALTHLHPIVQIGNSCSSFIMTPDADPSNPYWKFFQDAPFRADLGTKGPLISTIIRDRGGNEVLEIKQSHWIVYPQYSIDKNYSNDALEVKDSSGHVIFQIRIQEDAIYPTISVQGEWWSNENHGFRAVSPHENHPAEIISLTPQDEHLDVLIGEIFEYPSKTHWRNLVSLPQPSFIGRIWSDFKLMI